ncbi:MAG TPA: GDP-mannose 4,6-dehydratase [Gaiellaceae bacterium]|nr:GDP-mannose 4,6-dehydratase [Gaiellaceae bacterium]
MTSSRCALVIGAAGQDGSYLTELLLEQGYRVVGIVRADADGMPNLARVRDRIDLVAADLEDTDAILRAVATHAPAEIYNLASVSYGPDAWDDPVRTVELGGLAVARLLEGLRSARVAPRFFQASSSWVFGRPSESPQNERTPFAPVEPYGAAKALGDFLVRGYRERHDLFACSGLFYNHESPRRPERFVTRKITTAAASISLGLSDRLVLGDVESRRDWGFAVDYVRAAWLMLQADEPADFVVATGETHTVREFAEVAFSAVGVDLERHLVLDSSLSRTKGQVADLVGDASAARAALGWSPTVTFDELVRLMVDADLATLSGSEAART